MLHIFHTNDFHGSLTDEGAAHLRAAIAETDGAPYLLLDAGDAIKAGNVGVNPFGEPILERMSDTGYHAMTMGNREFHIWQTALETKINRARFPVLCANVRARHESGILPVQPLARFEVGGMVVVVFGLTVPMVTERMKTALAVSAFVFDDPVPVAQKMVASHRWGADLIILLSHLGLREDERLAQSVSGIDLIIGGHSHTVLETPRVVNNTPIVQAGWHARYFGHLTVTLPGGDSARPVIAGELHKLQAPRR